MSNDTDGETLNCVQEFRIDSLLKYAVVFVYGAVGVLSLVGNTIVLLMVACRKEMRTATNIFISSVSAADLVITSFSLWATPLQRYYGSWPFGRPMCYVVYTSASLMWAPMALAAIAVDRYMLVANPFRKQLTAPGTLFIIGCVYIFGFIVLSPMMYHLEYTEFAGPCHRYCYEYWKPKEYRLYYGLLVLALRSLIPVLIISFCHIRIAYILHSRSSKLSKHRSTMGATLEIKRKQRLQKVLLSMVLIFAVSSFPMDLVNVYQDVTFTMFENTYPSIPDIVFYIAHWVAMAGTLLNPLVYAYFNDNFHRQIKCIIEDIRGIRHTPCRTTSMFDRSKLERNADLLNEQQVLTT